MPRPKKIVVGPEGKSLKEWQARYATIWKQYVDSAAFQAGIQFLRNRKLERVGLLSEAEIEKNSREHLSDLRGYLQHESELLKLHEMTDFEIPFEEPEIYLSPEQEADEARLREKFQEENQKKRYARNS